MIEIKRVMSVLDQVCFNLTWKDDRILDVENEPQVTNAEGLGRLHLMIQCFRLPEDIGG